MTTQPTVNATALANYDGVTIAVDPATITAGLDSAINAAEDLTNQLNTIMNTMEAMQLSWTGTSSTVAQSFEDRWKTAIEALYGNSSGTSVGILYRFLNGVNTALNNYVQVDTEVAELFAAFSTPSSGSTLSTASVTNTGGTTAPTTTVDETY